jgi:formylglycine-generating enzyme required for sulfatase activity
MNLINYRSDIYCTEDRLGFDKYIDVLSSMIRGRDFKTPFCIGIFGEWGRGKTSFMHLLQGRISQDQIEPYIIPVWFNPWRYEKEEHLIIPFLKTIEREIEKYIEDQKGLEEKLTEKLKGAATKIGDAACAFAYGMQAECKLGLAKIKLDVAKMAVREKELAGRRIEEAQKLSETLASTYYDIVTELKNAVDKDFRIMVFIDDLDRCLPEKAVELLESIKLFLDLEGYLFVIGVDKEVVKRGISYRYRFFDHKTDEGITCPVISPEDYLDKMIQLPLELPPIESGKKRRYIESLMDQAEEFKEHADIIEIGVGENPRSLKRFINLLAFTARLAEKVKDNILDDTVEPEETPENKELIEKGFITLLYIKWSIIVFSFPRVHSDIKGNWERLIELQRATSEEGQTEKTGRERDDENAVFKTADIDERLRRILKKGAQFPKDRWLIERFIHLTEATLIKAKAMDETLGYRLDYKPGDMVRIPKGTFLYGEGRVERKIDDDYFIDRFPVTNQQYKEFLDDEKEYKVPYREEDYARSYNWDRENRIFPEGMEDHPVVLVSYQDAVKFCEWRSRKDGHKYRLPTDEEWEKAARGNDGRAYPWGEEFDKGKCNTVESGIGRTTPVTAYPGGASPHGCFDMAGNVWELTEDGAVVRGGSWGDIYGYARCGARFGDYPVVRLKNVGFRCVRTYMVGRQVIL